MFPLSSTALTFWPSYQPVGHGIHLSKPSKPTPISPCPDDLPASAIPSSVFHLPPSAQDTSPSLAPHDLLPLTRSLLRLQSPALLDIKAHFWTWWRHRKYPKTDSHHLHILKKLISNPTSLILTVPRSSWEWLLFFLARCCLGQVPGGAPFSQRSEQATACTNRMQIRN